MLIHVTDSNFEEKVIQSTIPVVVDLWAEWCGPCRMIGPIIEEMGVQFEGRALMAKVDVDSNPGISAKFGIRNIPTVLFIKDGKVVDKQVGAVPKVKFVEKLEAIL
jgi:thioredoxin 1